MPTSQISPEKKTSELAVEFLRQFILTFLLHKNSWEFIREHRPWQGLKQNRWMTGVMMLAAAIISWQFFRQIWGMFVAFRNDQEVFSAGITSVFENFSFEKVGWVLHGGKKYLVLVVLEIIIFHIVRQVLQIRTGLKSDSSFHAFMEAEVRMIKVSMMAWIMESIVRGLFNLGFGILGLDSLKFPIGLVVQFYFLGYSLIDNYMETYGWNIRDSEKFTRKVAGCAIATGMVAYLLMFVPLVGVVIATMLGAVTASLAMERFAPVVAQGGVREYEKTEKKVTRFPIQ